MVDLRPMRATSGARFSAEDDSGPVLSDLGEDLGLFAVDPLGGLGRAFVPGAWSAHAAGGVTGYRRPGNPDRGGLWPGRSATGPGERQPTPAWTPPDRADFRNSGCGVLFGPLRWEKLPGRLVARGATAVPGSPGILA